MKIVSYENKTLKMEEENGDKKKRTLKYGKIIKIKIRRKHSEEGGKLETKTVRDRMKKWAV